MSTSNNENLKRRKIEEGSDEETESVNSINSDVVDVESVVEENSSVSSYVLLDDSDDSYDGEYSEESGEGNDYFGSSSSSVCEESEVAWEDSDENLELRGELDEDAPWLEAGKPSIKITKAVKKIVFKYDKTVFSARCKIKLLKTFKEVIIAVDSFNLIYFISNILEKQFTTFKLELFKITGVCCFNGKYLFYSNSSSYIKQVDPTGKVIDIKKGTGNISKMVVHENDIYILGNKIYRMDKDMFIKDEFNGKFIDLACLDSNILALEEKGDIFVFNRELEFIEKLSFSFKFQFKSIYTLWNKIFITTDTGLLILDSSFKEIKSFSNLSEPITSLAFNDDFVFHGSGYPNSLRILKQDLTYYDRFPYCKIKINSVEAMDALNETLYFADSKFISTLKVQYTQ